MSEGRNRVQGVSVVVALLLAAPATAVGQDVEGHLARALLSTRDRALDLFVGAPAIGLATDVPLREGDVPMGGLVGASTAVLVFQASGPPRTALLSYGDHLTESGWLPGPDLRDPRGGFQNTLRPVAGVWCREGRSLQTTAMTFDSRHYLRVRVSERDGQPSVCDPNTPPRMMFAQQRLRFPVLTPHPRAVVAGSGGSGGGDAMEQYATVETEVGPESIFEHYTEQLSDADWAVLGVASDEEAMLGRWDTADLDGAPALGLFGLWSTPTPGVYRVWIRLERAPGR